MPNTYTTPLLAFPETEEAQEEEAHECRSCRAMIETHYNYCDDCAAENEREHHEAENCDRDWN